MMKGKRMFRLVALILVALLAIVDPISQSNTTWASEVTAVSDYAKKTPAALNFNLVTIDGTTVTTAATGRPKVLIIGQIGCWNCKNVMSQLKQANLKANAVDYLFLNINETTTPDQLREFRNTYGPSIADYCCDSRSAAWALINNVEPGLYSITTPFIIYKDANDTVVSYTMGNVSIISMIQSLLGVNPIDTTYSINFNGNKATSGSMSSMTNLSASKTYTLSANQFKRKGYTFKGWNTKADGSGKSYANGASVTGLSTTDGAVVTLYAQWAKKTYTITYKLGGGKNNSANPSTYTYTTATITLKNASRKGYTFAGWYSNSSKTKRVKEIKKGSTGNLTLYAKWKTKKYTIKYKLNGGKNNSANPTTYSIKTNTITLKNPTRSGYSFKGWYSDSKFTKRVTKITKGSTGNLILYAKWGKASYNVKFDLNGGTGTAPSTMKCTCGKSYSFEMVNAVKTGYTFAGWNTKADGTGTNLGYRGTFSNLTSKDGKTVTLYAIWEKNTDTAESYANEVLRLVNIERANNGLSPLKYDALLSGIAMERCKETVVSWSHERPNGESCFDLYDYVGYDYWGAGENIALGYTSPQAVVNGWMNSPGHRANILGNYNYLGVGVYNSQGYWYWVQNFAYR